MEVKKIADKLISAKNIFEQLLDVVDPSIFKFNQNKIKKLLSDSKETIENLPTTTTSKNINSIGEAMEFLEDVQHLDKNLQDARDLMQKSLNIANIVETIIKEAVQLKLADLLANIKQAWDKNNKSQNEIEKFMEYLNTLIKRHIDFDLTDHKKLADIVSNGTDNVFKLVIKGNNNFELEQVVPTEEITA